MMARCDRGGVCTSGKIPHAFFPAITLEAAHLLGEVHAFEAGPGYGLGGKRRRLGRAVRRRLMAERAGLGAARPQQACQPPGIDAGDADQPMPLQPIVKMFEAAPIGGRGDIGA